MFAEIHNDESSAKLIEAFQLLFLLVPPPNRMLLQQLLELLNLVTKTPHSKMTAHNLAVVFSPNIMDFRKVPIYFFKRIINYIIEKRTLGVPNTTIPQEKLGNTTGVENQ